MNVARAAYGGSIAEAAGNTADGASYIASGGGVAVGWSDLAKLDSRQHSSGPGSKILGTEFALCGFADIGVHVIRMTRRGSPDSL